MRYAHCAASTAACMYDVSIPTCKKLYIDNYLKFKKHGHFGINISLTDIPDDCIATKVPPELC
jgi:hypothetical protein